MSANIDREKILLILEWCITKFGTSKHQNIFPPRLRVYKSYGTSGFKNRKDKLRGTYLEGTITIYLGSIESHQELCETVIHEYKHYLMDDDEYDKITEAQKILGRDADYLFYNHPHEKRARYAEKKWGMVCYNEVKFK
jgi:hypothetical protein